MLSIRTKPGSGTAKVSSMKKDHLLFGINRAILLGDSSTPTTLKNWLKLCNGHDPTDLANWSEIFAQVLHDENLEIQRKNGIATRIKPGKNHAR